MSNIVYENENLSSAPESQIIAIDSNNLDFMRAVAVLLVLFNHLLEMFGSKSGFSFHPYDWYLGRIGVLLFFVHTSLVLMLSIERSKLCGYALFGSFYLRRVFRIYPLSVLCIISALLFEIPPRAWQANYIEWPITTVIANISLVQNITYSPSIVSPLWTLPLELQMYVVLPILFVYFSMNKKYSYLIATILFSIVIASVQPMVSGRLNIAQYIPCFLGGVLAWFMTKTNIKRSIHWIGWPLFLATIILMYFLLETTNQEIHPPWLGWIMCLTVGLCLLKFKELPDGYFSHTSTIIARYSYGIYLFHMFAIWYGFHIFADYNILFQWLIFFAIVILIPIITYHYLEKPLIKLGVKLAAKLFPIAK